jgi:hypothetical protein
MQEMGISGKECLQEMNTSTDVEGDWVKLEEYLRRCYRSIEHELLKHYAQSAVRTL